MSHGLLFAMFLMAQATIARGESLKDKRYGLEEEVVLPSGKSKGTGLNRFCHPQGTSYRYGSPLVHPKRTKLSRKSYLRMRGLNELCDFYDKEYPNPISDPKQYRANKKWAFGLNIYCDAIDTVYASVPTFDSRTGKGQTLEEYLKEKGLNRYCDHRGVYYAGGNPAFDPKTGIALPIKEYLARKYRVLNYK